MKLKTISISILIATGGLISSQASGQQNKNDQKKPPSFSQLLKEMDTDKDGKLSKSEVKGPLKNDFTKVDTDNDGFITEEEFNNAPKPEGGRGPRNNPPRR